MAKLHKNHHKSSPYEPDEAVDPKKNPRHSREGTRKQLQEKAAEKKAAPKKKAAKKK